MKYIMITGSGHNIGNCLATYLSNPTEGYQITADLLKANILIHNAPTDQNTTKELLEMASSCGINKFIYSSTGGVCGYKDELITEDCPRVRGQKVDDYYRIKAESEDLCNEYIDKMDMVILRYFFPYGPGTNPTRLIARLIDSVKQGNTVKRNLEGRPFINPIYIDDLCEIVRRIVDYEGTSYEIFNVAGTDMNNIEGITEIIGAEMGKGIRFKDTEEKTSDMIASATRILRDLDYVPEWSIRKGIRRTIKEFT